MQVGGETRCVICCIEREDRRLDEIRSHQCPDLGDCDMIAPVLIAEGFHPVEGVVVAVVVIHGALGITMEAHVDAGDAGEVLKGGEIAAGAHGFDVAVPEIADCLSRESLVRGRD